MNEREIVLDILLEMEKGNNSRSLIRNVLLRYDYLLPQQKAFIKRVSEGTLERRITLDYIIDQYASVKTKKQKPLIRNVLRLSVYQIFYMDQVPDSAVLNEAVNLTAKRGFAKLKGFVNAVLRNIVRYKDKINFPLPKKSDEKSCINALSVTYSMPELICRIFLSEYGYEKTEQIFKTFLFPRPVIIRMDERYTASEMEQLAKEMEDFMHETGIKKFSIKKNDLLSYAYELSHTDNITYLPGFEEGRWVVQDPSSMLVSEVAGIKKGDIVADVCSAPGGKTMHAAAKGAAKVYSRDLTEYKTSLIKENIERMRLEDIVECKVADATVHDDFLEDRCDVLYLDVPCSGLGIIGRKGDIKYSVTKDMLKSLTSLQKEIVQKSWNYVKKGGIMMYSTCTLNSRENEEIVEWICKELPFERVDITKNLPVKLQGEESAKEGYLKLIPGMYNTDGFFMAKLRRI